MKIGNQTEKNIGCNKGYGKKDQCSCGRNIFLTENGFTLTSRITTKKNGLGPSRKGQSYVRRNLHIHLKEKIN